MLLSMSYPDSVMADSAGVQAAAPSYAKWGKLAMEETAKAYPDAAIVDYKYEGRFEAGPGGTEERFRLWMRKDGREFGVRVSISLQTESERVRSVKLNEIGPE